VHALMRPMFAASMYVSAQMNPAFRRRVLVKEGGVSRKPVFIHKGG
jgi:hypothetical protein